MEPSGANTETGEGDERAIYPVRRHVPTGRQNSRKSSIFPHFYYFLLLIISSFPLFYDKPDSIL